MSKKRAKSGAGSAGVSRWESGILQTQFEEENWKASIAFVVGNRLEDKDNLHILTETVSSGLRKLFSVVSRESLLNDVHELGNPKAKKPKDVPLYSEICEVAKNHLDQGESIPLPLLAKLLKWKVLGIKQADIKRREDELKEVNGKGKGGKEGGGKRPRSKSPAKGKGKNKSPEIPSPKKESKLKKRGEEDQENKFIDDEPDDGPQHYIILQGFEQAPILILLGEIGVFVDSIIRVQSEDYARFEKKTDDEEEEEEDEKPPEVIAAEKAKREKEIADLEKFWLQHEPFLKKAPNGSRLHHVARLTYTVKDHIIPNDLQDNEQRTDYGTALFEDVACMMYDLLDAKRQYQNYLDNMKLIQVPLVGPQPPTVVSDAQSAVSVTAGLAPPATDVLGEGKVQSSDVDSRYYTEMMDCVPHESVSVPLIMHCMLEQIVATEEERPPPSEKSATPRDDGLEYSLAMHVEKMAAKLNSTNSSGNPPAERNSTHNKPFWEYISDTSDSNSTKPHFYHHGDNLARRLHHLKSINGFNPMEAELAMMDYIPVAKLREFPRPTADISKERAARLHELIHFCTSGSVDQAEFGHAFKQFVFESLKLRETDEEGLVLESEACGSESVVWDDPYPLFKKPDDDVLMELAVPRLPGEDAPQIYGKTDETLGPSSSQLGILKTTSRQGSAASVRSSRSIDLVIEDDDVHFEKDSSGQPILPDKDAPRDACKIDDNNGNNLAPPGKPQRPGSASSQIGVQDVEDKQFRNLDDWRFAEHFQPSVLIQVLEEARQVYPYMDTYHHKRDHSLLVVMHNPVGPNLLNYEPWDAKLHSDVGFRNYMEHVSTIPEVSNWICEEEFVYQAEIARKEMEAMRAAASSPAPPASRPSSSKSKSGKRSASPKKSRSKSPKGRRSASPTVSVDNLDPNSKNFMRPNSMKQWKVENDKLKEEEERKKQEKEKKGRPKSRSRSASPKKEDKEKKDDKKEKRPKSGRGSRNGKEDKDKVEESKPVENVPMEQPQEPERIYPFTGYDVGNDLIHGSGSTSTMFPCDGGQIRTEKTQIINGPAFVKTSVLKDGHIFVVHIIDPKEPSDDDDDMSADGDDKESVTEKADQEKPEKDNKQAFNDTESDGRASAASGDMSIKLESDGRASSAGSDSQFGGSRDGESPNKGMCFEQGDTKALGPAQKKEKPLSVFGSFTAALNDGMMLSFSNYGDQGKSPAPDKKDDVDIYIPPPASPSPPPQAQSPTGKRAGSGKKGKKQQQQQQAVEQEKLAQQALEQQQKEEEERQKKLVEETQKSKEPELPPFQQLFISCPDGLHVNYLTEAMTGIKAESANAPDHLLVRQCYPYKTCGKQQCESTRQTPAMEELSRLITCEGTVIKTMKDGSTQVLFADGGVSCSDGVSVGSSLGMGSQSRDPSPQRGGSALSMAQGSEIAKKGHGRVKKKGGKGKGKHKQPKRKGKNADKSDDIPALEVTNDESDNGWVTTAHDGTRIATKPDGTLDEVKPCMLFSAKDPVTAEVMTTREDRVVIVERPDKTRIVDHNEGTRITTYYKQVELFSQCDNGQQEETGETPPRCSQIREVKQVKVECVGFATVIFNCEDSIATTIFGNGTQVISIPDGSYEVFHSEGSRLHVDGDGTALYTHKNEQEADNPDTLYTMRHKQAVIFEMVDKNGNMFSVKNTGDGQVLKGLDLGEEKDGSGEGEDGMEKGKMEEDNQHAPRFFVIHDDGSGMELLRMKDIREYLEIADRDPTTAILTDPIPDHPDIKGINIMRPYSTPLSQSWLLQFDESNIIPAHLKSRDFSKLPPYEAKQLGPKFGTNVGKGVAVGSIRKPTLRGPIPACPSQLELRQFTEYKPLSKELRDRMRVGLEAYAKEVEKKRKTWMDNAIKDPRSEEEKAGAGELLAHILAQEEETAPAQEDNTQPDGTTATEGVPPKDTTASGPAMVPTPKPKDVSGSKDVKALYETATAPPPLPPTPKPKNKYTDDDWEKVRKELEEERACRKALQKREVPNYFDSEWGKSFLLSLSAGPDMETLTKNLAVETRKGEGEGANHSLPSTPAETPVSTRNASGEGNQSGADSTSPQKQANLAASREGMEVTPTQGISPSDVRPLNPTPGHAQGKGTPTPLRPTNPTPGHASLQGAPTRPGNPTPGGNTDNQGGCVFPSETPSSYASFPNHPSTIPEEGMTERTNTAQSEVMKQSSGETNSDTAGYGAIPSAQSDIILTKSLVTDVNGQPRKDTVRLPAAILGTRPGAVPNDRFQTLEDPVRRKTLNSSIAGAEAKGIAPLSTMRGFELVPGEVHFGTLREGCTYAFTVHLKNVGIDGCRYKIKQPPPATGMQVLYKPGPIAAGMKAQLELQLYAIAVGVRGGSGQGSIGHHIEIVTENEMLYLPVSANIMTAYEYDECTRTEGKPALSAGVRLVSNRPPSREGIIRPRKGNSKDSRVEIDAQLVQ